VLATDTTPAFDALRNAGALLKQRQAQHIDHPRVLIVVDEYTDLVGDTEGMSHADRIARQGRSANINMLVATQHPTSKALGGSTIKNNFTNRVIGSVADANAASNAAGRPGTHAELLPGKGSFLLVTGPDVIRLQSYWLTDVDIESIITRIGRKWRNESSTTTAIKSIPTRVVEASRTPVEAVVVEDLVELHAPIRRDEIDEMVDAMRPHWRPGVSKNAISQAAFGKAFAGTTWTARVNAALDRLTADQAVAPKDDGKIIRLRKAG